MFSLFSVYLYLSTEELHKVYIVISDNSEQTIAFDQPKWVASDSGFQSFVADKIEYVRHSEIIPLECLPTFNSHVIELYLSNIANLLESFVYFNDDCFLGARVGESFFFQSGEPSEVRGKSSMEVMETKVRANVFASTAAMKLVTNATGMRGRPQTTTMFQSIMNRTFDMLQARFAALRSAQSKWNKCHHQAKPLLKSSCQAVLRDATFATAIQQLSSRKFRTRHDFAPIELMIGFMYFTGKRQPVDAETHTFYIEWTQDATSMQRKFDYLLQRGQSDAAPVLICINDIPFEEQQQGPATTKLTKTKTTWPSAQDLPRELSRGWKVQTLSQLAYRYFRRDCETTA